MTATNPHEDIPQATLRPDRRLSWFWLIPALALALAGWIGYQSWLERGYLIAIHFDEGHGLEPGADVRYRGITVGAVRSAELARDREGIRVIAALQPDASPLAVAGTRFWIVRPQLDLTGVAGVETLVGPRYIALSPGDGEPRRAFLGLTRPPIVESFDPGDLEIILQAPERGGLTPGAPVLYREVPIGKVLSTGLSSDGGAVEARVHIQKAYTQLIRPQTRFWQIGGFQAQVGLKGLSLDVKSLKALLAGGVALATPPDAGDVVLTGHRFTLVNDPEEEWLEWQPLIAVGSSLLPAGATVPSPMRAVAAWREGRWFKGEHSRRGWVLLTDRGLLGPADLLRPADVEDEAEAGSMALEVAGRHVPIPAETVWSEGGLALIDVELEGPVWPRRLIRTPEAPEDCIIVGDPVAAPIPLSAARLTLVKEHWTVDPLVPLDQQSHGAAVVARADGRLIGQVLVTEEEARIALLPGL
jgi:hypothetical protein